MAPAERVWALLLDWPAIIDWMPDGYVQGVRMEGSGVGAVRHILTGKGVQLAERLDQADEAKGVLELSLVGELPWNLLSYHARGTLERQSRNSSRLHWKGTAELSETDAETGYVAKLLGTSYRKMFQGIRHIVESPSP
jgi:hypothetical protein